MMTRTGHRTKTGGTVERVVLHPLSISRTDVSPNPHPVAVVWLGPIVGSVVPLPPAASRGARPARERLAK
jgi:hypothetical protein